jgi:hypothetical protein
MRLGAYDQLPVLLKRPACGQGEALSRQALDGLGSGMGMDLVRMRIILGAP